MRFCIIIICLSWLLKGCVPIAGTQGSSTEIRYEDAEYAPVVGHALLSPGLVSGIFQNPVINISQQRLSLAFDLIEEEFSYLNIKIFHCDKDWKKSMLSDLEFIEEFNEIPVNNYSFSQSLYSKYVSYQITLPQLTRSGNYVVAVFRDNSSRDLLLTRRFVVFEPRASVSANIELSVGIEARRTHHQIAFDVRYGSLNIINPNMDISVVLLQNHNWNTGIKQLLPTNIRADQQLLEYRQFDGSNNFPAGNDFRFFDITTLAARGQQVSRVGMRGNAVVALLEPQKSRAGQAFSEPLMADLNGKFYLRNRNPFETDVQSEYVNVTFTLESEPIAPFVFIAGRFNNWQMNEDNMMLYDTVNQRYEGSLVLKQGFYNYQFWVPKTEPMREFEGSHQQCHNEYELFVYYREPGTIYDQVIGYSLF